MFDPFQILIADQLEGLQGLGMERPGKKQWPNCLRRACLYRYPIGALLNPVLLGWLNERLTSYEEHMDETEAADCNRNSSFLLKDEGELYSVL